jgi:putative ABC transport system permease protein
MDIPLIRGRLFTSTDGPASPKVVVVNESFVRRFWPSGDAIGRRVKQGFPEDKNDWREIVGIVRDVKTGGVDRPAGLQVYVPLAQEPSGSVAIVAWTRGEVASFGHALEAAVHQVDPNLPVYDIRTLYEVIGRDVGQQRLTMILLLGFAALALLMAAIGVFGVTAYAVSQRTHELGLRMALGATRGQVVRLVLREELVACAGGVVIGVAGALALSSLLETLVYGVAARDAGTLAVVSLILVATTTAAGYLPARRATRIEPVTALRIE